MNEYECFLERKKQSSDNFGFKPKYIPDFLFDFQKSLVEWSIEKGRSAIFADCGLGKTPMQLVIAQNILEETNKPVLIITPLAVSMQTVLEANKFNIDVERSSDGKFSGKKIVVTNYERLHNFNASDFAGVICDESSILKNFKGHIKHDINIFMRKIKYRLLTTATAAPNDFIELGNSSEALGYLGFMDMLNRFFKNDQNNCDTKGNRGRFTEQVKWRLKGHAHSHFWKWITSWARACRKPSDLGFSNDNFILPKLNVFNHELKLPGFCLDGFFPEFAVTAIGMDEVRKEVRATIKDRVNKTLEIVESKNDYSVIWCNLNEEGDLLEKSIKGSVQVSGKDTDESKERKLIAFSKGEYKTMIIKPKIGAFGLNWQHCNNVIFFPTYSYEQYYQAIRRCYRFGQKREVNVDVIYSEGLGNVVFNLERKQKQAEEMFQELVNEMNNSISIDKDKIYNAKEEIPSWL